MNTHQPSGWLIDDVVIRVLGDGKGDDGIPVITTVIALGTMLMSCCLPLQAHRAPKLQTATRQPRPGGTAHADSSR